MVASAGTVTVTGGDVPPSKPETLSAGTYYWTASYSGDMSNKESSSKCGAEQLTVIPSVAGGNFVIGDQNATVGTAVTFWGAHWWKLNSLSDGSAPPSFKGFATSSARAQCGTTWTTNPGNSTPPPPGPLPERVVVIVSSSVSKVGSAIAGNTTHIVVIETNPGYAGTGRVVSQIC